MPNMIPRFYVRYGGQDKAIVQSCFNTAYVHQFTGGTVAFPVSAGTTSFGICVSGMFLMDQYDHLSWSIVVVR